MSNYQQRRNTSQITDRPIVLLLQSALWLLSNNLEAIKLMSRYCSPQNISSDCRLFADDVLLCNIRENLNILQNDLNKLEEQGKLWQLAFNNNKCSVLSIHDNTLQQPYYLNNSRLRNVLNHPYLRIELSYDLKWGKTYN